MGKPGPLDDGFANGVRFVFGAIFGLLVVLRLVTRELARNYGYAPIPAAFIALCVGIVLLCGFAAAKYRDDFWQEIFDVIFWWRR